MKVLEGEQRVDLVDHITLELNATAARLGFDMYPLIKELAEPPVARRWNDTVSIQVKSRAWAVGVTLDIKLVPDTQNSHLGYRATCELSWSSTGRSIAEAVHTVSLYQRAIEMAASIEGLVQ